MPVNRNALIRYKTLDKCLQNRYRKWTLNDLIDACSDALYEYEGIDKGVSKRTVQADIQVMRSDKLGYNAPIIVVDKRYYTYEEPTYSITNIPLTDQDLNRLTDAVAFMKQFKGFSHFKELDGMVQKLEDHIYSQKTQTKPVIDFEKNDNLKGLEYLDVLYQAIIKKEVLKITYQSFKARSANSFAFHPYLLKEFRNRWFLIGIKEGAAGIMNLALDRIEGIEASELWFQESEDFEAESYFKDAIGVSISPKAKVEEVRLYVNYQHAPYVLTKPLHHSQELIEKDHYGITIALKVQHNFELEKAILGFGEGVKVLAPDRLRRKIKERINANIDLYNTEITERGLRAAGQKLTHKGLTVLNHLYSRREIKLLNNTLHKKLGDRLKEENGIVRQLLVNQPALVRVLFNRNLTRLVESIDPSAVLVKATFFNKPPRESYYQNWHQPKGLALVSKDARLQLETIPDEILGRIFCIRIHLDDTQESNGQQFVLPGSHNKRFTKEEINLLSNNSHSYAPDLHAGSVLLMNALLLSNFSTPPSLKRRRVIHLEFTSSKLSDGFEWAEALEF
ncbi:MAG: Phytanoyl-CoA dioxygenase [uncultured Aureispira sp.]|uniref:Phytanoyl-CoA dioxygenase n=1 Tax=uncultured Aureispira sp. TaxID=1331704 RepID=A0A6S6TF31_9BACT|nr:MAG: Phytanoyl-CoA dioxygenase [uncultured Aureispira sp.]